MMKHSWHLLLGGILSYFPLQAQTRENFAQLDYYKTRNVGVVKPAAVFFGDSITEMWYEQDSVFFKQHHYVNRGISGQTSSQLLLRLQQDVIALRPATMVLLCGINDIAGNTGPVTLQDICNNISAMAELAAAHHIKVILCSVLPANKIFWNPGVHPEAEVVALNQWIRAYARQQHLDYVDYYSLMVDENKGLQSALTVDGVHCTPAGYKIMEQAISAVFSHSPLRDR